ncbi:MAG TPA: hypothetical protein VEO53_13245 [Candidatus Binatia bacterium]|nr:hypothetical protein [Candidatus Binatia bacterium]
MLMNLLPGLRDLRAPLAAGYLWLTGLWVLLSDAVPSRSTATGVLAHAYALTAAVGRGAVLVAVSFLAYLIGAVLSVDSDGAVVHFLAFIFSRQAYSKASARPMASLAELKSYLASLAGQISPTVRKDIIDYVERLKRNAVITSGGTPRPNNTEISVIQQWNAGLHQPIFGLFNMVDSLYGWVISVWLALTETMLASINSEVRQLVTQLRVSSPALFDQYDRARGEAEFRISVAFPLTFVAGALAWKWTPLWLFLLPGVALITRSGLRRASEATDVVAQAALAGYVTPSGWPSPKSNPLTVARQALDDALGRDRLGISHLDLNVEKMQFIRKLLQAAPLEQPADAATAQTASQPKE